MKLMKTKAYKRKMAKQAKTDWYSFVKFATLDEVLAVLPSIKKRFARAFQILKDR